MTTNYHTPIVNGQDADQDTFNAPLGELDAGITAVVGVAQAACQGRLTLESGVPVSASDQTAKTTLYFTPYNGSRVALYDGTKWVLYAFTERSLSLAALAADTNYDVFLYDNAGTLTLEQVAWASGTARATALALQDGVYVRSGDASRRYLGTFRTTATIGQCEDSRQRRLVWNNYNRVFRALRRVEATNSWTYSSTPYRYLNNNSANRVEIVVGLSEDAINLQATVHHTSSVAGVGGNIAIGADSSTNPAGTLGGRTTFMMVNEFFQPVVLFIATPAIGFHFYAAIESGGGSGTQTWYGTSGGDTAGITGLWLA